MSASDEREYYNAVSRAGNRVLEIEDPEEAEEALQAEAENEVIYYHRIRRIIRWTDNEDAIMDVQGEVEGADGGDSVYAVLTPIAFFAFRADVQEWMDRQ